MWKFAHYKWNYVKRHGEVYGIGHMRKTEFSLGKLSRVSEENLPAFFSLSCIITVQSAFWNSDPPPLPLSLTSFCFSIRHKVFSTLPCCNPPPFSLMFISSFACFTARSPLLYWKWDRERNRICYMHKAPHPSSIYELPCMSCASLGSVYFCVCLLTQKVIRLMIE